MTGMWSVTEGGQRAATVVLMASAVQAPPSSNLPGAMDQKGLYEREENSVKKSESDTCAHRHI